MGDSNTQSGVGEDSIEWHYSKIKSYFDSCFDTVYNPFLDMSDDLVNALLDYVNDDQHTGPKAEETKKFVNEMQIHLVEDTIYCIQLLQGMMQGDGFEDKKALLDDFIDTFSETEDAVIKTAQLKKIIDDFASYNESFVGIHPTITQIHSDVESIASGCDVITRKSYTKPKPADTVTAMDDFVSTDKTSGFVPEFRQNFLDFHDKHSDDIDGSTFKTLLDTIVSNLTEIVEGMNNGTFDISRYTGTKGNINWTNITDVLEGKQLEDYLAYMKTYQLYLQGLVDRCQVYKYDPVNMSSGNYINDRVDLTVGGLHKISLRRFYNAQSETKGILGRGWSCLYDTRLTEDLDGKISITTFDGRSLIYEKTIYGKEEAYLEIHGEEGVLRKSRNGYRITKDDGTYTEYDREGYLRSEGENDKDYISIIYDTLQIDGEVKPLPVKVVTDDGSYIELFYDSEGYLTKVIDNTDRTLSYGYEIRVIEGKKEYFLTDVTYPNGAVRRYSYNEQGLIDSVLSPDGIVALRNEYDEKRRVTHQIFPDGGEMSYSYDDENNITTATEQNGLKVEYLSDERGRNIGTRYVGVEPGDTVQDVNNSEKVVEEHCTYNERNQKTSVTDRRGYTTRYFYDRHGHLTKVIGPDGLNESYTYNADGKLVNKKDSEGNSYKYTYDLEGNLYSITDPEGNRTRYYYEDGKVTKIKSADRLEVSLSYDENGHISSITDKAGVTTKYECDSLGRVTATIDALGNRTEYTLDESDNITSVTDPLGNVTRYAYNSANLLEEIINPDGTTKIWAYNEIGKPFLYIDEEDHTTRITYNSSWKEDSITLPNGGEIHYTYDLLGNMICVTDPMGRKTGYSHDKAGNVLTVAAVIDAEKDSDNNGTPNGTDAKTIINRAYTYDKLGRVKTETDGEGNTTTYTYDKNGNVITVTHANGSKTENSYDSMGRLVSTTDPEGNVTSYTYDVSGNLKTTTDPIGVVTENYYEGGKLVKVTKKAATDDLTVDQEEIIVNIFEYDECGRLNKQTETDGLYIEYSYDKAGRTSTVTGSNGRVIKYSYDSMGRVAQTDDCGSITRFTYTGTGKIKSVTDALGNRTEYTYNELDLLSRIERFGDEDVETDTLEENFINRDESAFPSIDRKGHVTTFEHDLSGKLISETDALGQKTIYSYDERGELASQIDRDGNETIFTRDNAGNIVGISYADGHSVRLKYDALNILQEVEDHLGLTKIDTDNLGRCVSVTNPDGEKVSYEYGPNGEKTAVIYPDGKRAEYVYDSLGRLKALRDIKDGKTDTINYTYDVNGHLKERIFPNGTGTTYDYYPGGLLKRLTSTDSKGILDKYEYTYNEKGDRTSITRQRRDLENISGTYAYSYDDLGRLTQSTRNGNLQSAYTYDAFGNRTSETAEGMKTTYSYDILDRLVRKSVEEKASGNELLSSLVPTVTTYDYDRRGNLTAEYENEALTKSYSYNMQNLLEKSVIRNTEADIQTVTYAYNYFGQRISKKSGLEEVRYLTDITRDHYNLLAQNINGHTTSFTYDDNVVSFEREGTRNFYQLDELGSTMYLTGTDGAAYNPYAYDSFGNRIDPYTGKIQRWYNKQNNITQPFAFTGYQEEESNLYYAQARNYDPMSGRFTGEDCVRGYINCPDSINHYIYCFNDPRQYVDRNGKEAALALVEFGIIILGIYCGYVYTVNTIMCPQPVSVPSLWDTFPRFDSNEPSIDIIPKGDVQTPTIEAPYAEPQEKTTIEVIPGGDVLVPKLLKPWESIPALTPQEPTILMSSGLNYENGSSIPSSKKLRDNMINAGIEVPNYPNAAHHIVAGTAKGAKDAREILKKYKIDINDANNGVFLPTNREVDEGTYHPSMHTGDYYDKVTKELNKATSREECIEILNNIAEELQNGTFMEEE
ncbi:MAG: hypothetical protein E7309_04435 [Butyrivibrio sp.]|nr:hypothetical protein [Butyrivibrio sp.]